MKSFIALLALLPLFSSSFAAPTAGGPSDDDILNYALTLEHLENAFYAGALAQFDQAAFVNAGLPEFARSRFEEIAAHEAIHVAFLQTALGDKATSACNYTFPYTDPASFAALSQILEGVGTTAYLGAAQYITNPAYLTVAGAILTTEARHAAWVASAVLKGNPWSGPFDTPLDFNQVYSLAAPFITSCPSSNPVLPVKAFPTLNVTNAVAGQNATLSFSGETEGQFLAVLSGLNTTFVPIEGGSASLPADLQGTVYVLVSSNSTAVSDAATVAGPAILVFPF